MDDNINGFYRLNHNLKIQVSDGTIFQCMEDFVNRYNNISMAGPNYFMFTKIYLTSICTYTYQSVDAAKCSHDIVPHRNTCHQNKTRTALQYFNRRCQTNNCTVIISAEDDE